MGVNIHVVLKQSDYISNDKNYHLIYDKKNKQTRTDTKPSFQIKEKIY